MRCPVIQVITVSVIFVLTACSYQEKPVAENEPGKNQELYEIHLN